jgi:hypothetical protein
VVDPAVVVVVVAVAVAAQPQAQVANAPARVVPAQVAPSTKTVLSTCLIIALTSILPSQPVP